MSAESDLSELQNWMASVLVLPQSLTRSPNVSAQAGVHIRASARLSAVEQLEIYREQFWLRHTASLLEDFPGLSRLLGQDAWESLVEGYLEAHPPTSPTLRDLGRSLPEYLEGIDDAGARSLEVDMARLEWAYLECFDAADSGALDRARLGQLSEADWENGRVVLSPALRLLPLRHPVAELRRLLLNDDLEQVPRPEAAVSPLVVFRREDGSVWDQAVSPVALALLDAFSSAVSLVKACESVLEGRPEAEAELDAHLTSWFSTWGALGWIVGFEVDPA